MQNIDSYEGSNPHDLDQKMQDEEYYSSEGEEEEMDSSMGREIHDRYFNHSLSDIYTSQASYH